jgi:hypothetical protein
MYVDFAEAMNFENLSIDFIEALNFSKLCLTILSLIDFLNATFNFIFSLL